MLAKRQNALGLALPDGIAAGDDHLQPCGVKRHEPERQPGEQARAAQEHQPGDQVLHSRRWLGDALSDARIARSAVDIARAAFTHHRLRLRADGRTRRLRPPRWPRLQLECVFWPPTCDDYNLSYSCCVLCRVTALPPSLALSE